MGLTQFISSIIEKELQGSEHFLVSVDANSAETKLQFYVDGDSGLGIKPISRLTRTVSRMIDESEFAETAFRFEISSPGADNPLVDIRQYKKHIGRNLAVTTNDSETCEGKLIEVKEAGFMLECVIDKKKKQTETREFALSDIKETKVKISFKK